MEKKKCTKKHKKLYKNIFELNEFVTLIQKLAEINRNKRKMHTYIISETSVCRYTVLFRKFIKGTVKQTCSWSSRRLYSFTSHALLSVAFVCVRALGSAPVPGATFFRSAFSVVLLSSSRNFL